MATYLTQEGFNKKMEELSALEAQRPMIKQAIAEARDKGDLSENAEYDAARNEQAANEGEIAELDYKIKNAEIIEESGSQTGTEGCLSVPGKSGTVTRPNHVIVRALDEDMNAFELEGEELLARCICHECEHLHGHLYVERVEGELKDVKGESEE